MSPRNHHGKRSKYNLIKLFFDGSQRGTDNMVKKVFRKEKSRPSWSGVFRKARRWGESALTCFEPTLRLVDHIDTALAAYHTAIAMPVLQRAERVANFHSSSPFVAAREGRLGFGSAMFPKGNRRFMVGDTGIEPVTPSMSTKCSTAELIALSCIFYHLLKRTRRGASPALVGVAIIGSWRHFKGFWHRSESHYSRA